MAIIECIPNISEGRRADIVAAIGAAVRRVPGARLLDFSSDASHNRSVITMAGDAASAQGRGARAVRRRGRPDRSANAHGRTSAHGRCRRRPVRADRGRDDGGLRGAGEGHRAQCRGTILRCRSTCTKRHRSIPLRKNLEDIRRGEFEGLAAKMATDGWAPDFGPSTPHPTAGASVIGARMPLIAYNINLSTDRLDVAKKIAAAVRFSSGGFRFVKAMGVTLADRGIVQVSMNLTNYEKTPILRVFEAVKREAERYGVNVLESEIVGLVPICRADRDGRILAATGGFQA